MDWKEARYQAKRLRDLYPDLEVRAFPVGPGTGKVEVRWMEEGYAYYETAEEVTEAIEKIEL